MLTPEQKKQLDDNIKLMISKGTVTKQQIEDYAKAFLAKYDKQQTPKPATPKQVMPDWSSYPCVVSLANSKGVKIDINGAYLIDNFRYFANGRKGDLTTRKVLDYTCNDPEFKTQQTPDKTQTSSESTYTICPETLPVKKFCKNQIVKDVQRCLRDKHQMSLKDDGKFGPKTEKALIKF